MKLMFCEQCRDIVLLGTRSRECRCRRSSGVYLDGVNTEISGPAIHLYIDNASFAQAMWDRPDDGEGERFDAFVIPKNCPTVKEKRT